jgi:hypothetical protein
MESMHLLSLLAFLASCVSQTRTHTCKLWADWVSVVQAHRVFVILANAKPERVKLTRDVAAQGDHPFERKF